MNASDRLFERLIKPIENQMIGIIWRIIRDPEEVKDVFQNVLERIWIKFKKIDQHPNPNSYIFRICVTCSYDALRKRTRRFRYETFFEDIKSSILSSNKTNDVKAHDRKLALNEAISMLPQKQGKVVLLRSIQNFSYEMIGSILGCSEATARSHFSKGKVSAKKNQSGSFRWHGALPRPRVLAWSFALACVALIIITIGMTLLPGKSAPTWAEVHEHFSSVPFYSGSFYLRTRSFFDSTKRYSFTNKRPRFRMNNYTLQIEFWIGRDNRIRITNGRTVTFAKRGDFVKTYNLDSRKEVIPGFLTIRILERQGYADYFDYKPKGYDFGQLFLGKIPDTTDFINTHTEISNDLVVFDVESDEGHLGHWRFRIWAMRHSKLPIRILGQNSFGDRVDNVFSYVKERPDAFFDPDIFEAKLKDPNYSTLDLMYEL